MRRHLELEHRSEQTVRDIQDAQSKMRLKASLEENGAASTISSQNPNKSYENTSALNRGRPIASSRVTHLSFQYTGTCPISCGCSCHKQRYLRTPNWANQVLGSLLVGYSGLTGLSPRCHIPICQNRSGSNARITYIFPWWVLSRVLAVHIAYTQPEGPELCLRVLRVCPKHADIFFAASMNYVSRIKKLLSQGKASVLDVEFGTNRTALHVRICCPIAYAY